MSRRGSQHTISLAVIVIFLFFMPAMLVIPGTADAGGPFGPPQPLSKAGGGLHTGIGYWFQEAQYQNGTDPVVRQHQIYSEIGYGYQNFWEIYARVGLSDLKISDAFLPNTASTITSKYDFEENWKFFSTLGIKGFYPFNKTFGLGAFIQGVYTFSDFTDNVSGTQNGIPFVVELGVKGMWQVAFGMAVQTTVADGIKLYVGPYLYYAEAKTGSSANIPGLTLTTGDSTVKNRSVMGGFAGIEISLAKGFRLTVEGRFAERWSAGAAVIYAY